MAKQLKITAKEYQKAVAGSADKKRLSFTDLSFIEEVKPKKANKYKAKKVEYDGHIFDSKFEYERYLVLKSKEDLGEISELTHHPSPFLLQEGFRYYGKNIRSITYCPDFLYKENGRLIAEDTKGMITEASRIRMKMFQSKYQDIELRIIKR